MLFQIGFVFLYRHACTDIFPNNKIEDKCTTAFLLRNRNNKTPKRNEEEFSFGFRIVRSRTFHKL